MPSHSYILDQDIAYHLGQREDYHLRKAEDAVRSATAPDSAFLSFDISRKEILAGQYYKANCRIEGRRIAVVGKEGSDKQQRTIKTVNRDSDFMDNSAFYAFNMMDARRLDYACIFGTDKPIPVFQYHRRRGATAPISPLYLYHQFPSWNIPSVFDKRAFRDKVPKAIWRGAMSGEVNTSSGLRGTHEVAYMHLDDAQRQTILRQSSRFTLCQDYASDDRIDAGFVINWGGIAYPSNLPWLQNYSKARMTREQQLDYRYLLALDGYDGPSSWYWMLNTNSVVLRQQSNWQMFGDCYFQPFVHYVPIAADMSDLPEMLDWCESHAGACKQISANARATWAILFDRSFQVERQSQLLATYNSWFDV